MVTVCWYHFVQIKTDLSEAQQCLCRGACTTVPLRCCIPVQCVINISVMTSNKDESQTMKNDQQRENIPNCLVTIWPDILQKINDQEQASLHIADCLTEQYHLFEKVHCYPQVLNQVLLLPEDYDDDIHNDNSNGDTIMQQNDNDTETPQKFDIWKWFLNCLKSFFCCYCWRRFRSSNTTS